MKIDNALKTKLKNYLKEEIMTKTKKYVEIVTSYRLSDEERILLLNKYPVLQNAELTNTVDPTIIGGFVLKFGSTVFDASIAGSITHYVDKLYEYR